MSGELSPDRQYFWDGSKWASAVSADGAWRWDGRYWRPAHKRAGITTPIAIAIAAGTIAALLLGGLGVAVAVRFVNAQQAALQAGLGSRSCGAAEGPGLRPFSGQTFCAQVLGSSYLAADCMGSAGLPNGLEAQQEAGAHGTWSAAEVASDAGGCELNAQPDQTVSVATSDIEPAGVVVVADFVPVNRVGSVGIELACIRTGSCIDITIYSDGAFSLDEGAANDTWKNISKGPLPLLSPGLRLGQLNRLVLRLGGGVAAAFLNGIEVTHGRPTITQVDGYATFYAYNIHKTTAEHLQLRQLYVFGSS
jgi:hypothetical protein